jgi:transcriptional regulator with XRE-family HTH domain
MSEQTTTEIPEWTLGWRMQRALAHADLQTTQIAAEIGVSRSTVSAWLNDRGAEPRIGYLKLWAMRCGVSLEWLLSGTDVRRPGSCPSEFEVAA